MSCDNIRFLNSALPRTYILDYTLPRISILESMFQRIYTYIHVGRIRGEKQQLSANIHLLLSQHCEYSYELIDLHFSFGRQIDMWQCLTDELTNGPTDRPTDRQVIIVISGQQLLFRCRPGTCVGADW